MELSKQEIELLLLLPGLWSKNFSYKMFLIRSKGFKINFQNRKWNYSKRKWNYFSHFQASDQKTSSMQVCKCANVQVCKYASMHVCKYASMQVCKYASMQVYLILRLNLFPTISKLNLVSGLLNVDKAYILLPFWAQPGSFNSPPPPPLYSHEQTLLHCAYLVCSSWKINIPGAFPLNNF